MEQGGKLTVIPPTWRPDLKFPADLVEEIARNIGYHQIPSVLPPRVTSAALTDEQRRRRVLAQSLVSQGYT